MASQSIIFFLLFNIMFLTRMHAQDLMPNLGMASAPTPAPVNPDMAPTPSAEPLNPGTNTACPAPSSEPINPVMAPAPSAAPLDPGMASAPSAAPLDPGMASAPSAAPLDPGMAPAPSSGPFDLGIALPPTLASLNLNCSSCPIDPFGLAACGILISGKVSPDTISYCCKTLSDLTKEDASACLCNAIQTQTVKIGNLDVTYAINKALIACSKL